MHTCDTPYCDVQIPPGGLKRAIKGYYFCDACRLEHSLRVLTAQAEHQMPIAQVLLDSSAFQSAGGMADYIGVSFVTVYNWILKYYRMTFQEFRRQYICKSSSRDNCYVLDIRRSSYSRHDYVLKKLRARRYCACINTLDDSLIMTNAPLRIVQDIIRGRPRIEKINDDTFALVPTPVHDCDVTPVYFDSIPAKVEALPDPMFFEKILLALYRVGGSSRVDDLRGMITTGKGCKPRKNNTRREVYRRPQWLEFKADNDQVMVLSEAGIAFVESDLGVRYPHLLTS